TPGGRHGKREHHRPKGRGERGLAGPEQGGRPGRRSGGADRRQHEGHGREGYLRDGEGRRQGRQGHRERVLGGTVRSIPEIQQAMNELETSRLDAIWARDDDAERACNRAYGVLATELKRAESRQASVVSSRPRPTPCTSTVRSSAASGSATSTSPWPSATGSSRRSRSSRPRSRWPRM